jgi:hypothetical protein
VFKSTSTANHIEMMDTVMNVIQVIMHLKETVIAMAVTHPQILLQICRKLSNVDRLNT